MSCDSGLIKKVEPHQKAPLTWTSPTTNTCFHSEVDLCPKKDEQGQWVTEPVQFIWGHHQSWSSTHNPTGARSRLQNLITLQYNNIGLSVLYPLSHSHAPHLSTSSPPSRVPALPLLSPPTSQPPAERGCLRPAPTEDSFISAFQSARQPTHQLSDHAKYKQAARHSDKSIRPAI